MKADFDYAEDVRYKKPSNSKHVALTLGSLSGCGEPCPNLNSRAPFYNYFGSQLEQEVSSENWRVC